jgi:multisubunit Na+/H+ antiporter MnhC subunit
LSFVAIDIGASLRLWRAAISSGMFGRTAFDAAASAVVERADPAYANVLLAGAVVTVATAAILLALVYRERRARVHISSTATDA